MPAYNNRFRLNKFMGMPIAAVFLIVGAIVFIGLSFSTYLAFDNLIIAVVMFMIAMFVILIAAFLIRLGDRILFIRLLVQDYLERRSRPIDGMEKE